METGYDGNEYDAWLASVCMPSSLLRPLIERFGDPASCYRAYQQRDPGLCGMIPPRYLRLLEKNGTAERLQVMKILMERHSVRVMRISDELYPASLMNVNDPPPILFYQGDPSCLKRRILAMVGSRAASYDGQKAAGKVASDLSRHGVSIISGLAGGIDTAAHEGCIRGGSPTIAVTGCGLDRVYPSENEPLRDRILSCGGLILSEYAPGEKPAGWHFPIRNRIITGLAEALILMEARIRSGSMTSVRHALDQGRDVFVYPGDPSSDYFEGNHQLLREGGIYFTSAEDVLEDLRWLDNPSAVRQNSDCSSKVNCSTPEEEAVFRALQPGMLSFEQLLIRTGLDPAALMGALTVLQIRGMIEALPGKQYRLKQ